MLIRMMGAGSLMAGLRTGLSESTRSVRSLAHQLANASTPGALPGAVVAQVGVQDGNTGELPEGAFSEAALEETMVRLADEQLRFDSTANLLQKVHQQFRSAIRER